MTLSAKTANGIIAGLVGIVLVLIGLIIYGYFFMTEMVVVADHDQERTEAEQSGGESSQFLREEEMVVLESSTSSEDIVNLPVEKVLFEFVEVVDSCGPHFEGECLRVRSGPGTTYPTINSIRNGAVLKVGGKVEHEGKEWYKIVFDEWLRYPDRVKGEWYIAADHVRILLDEGQKTIWENEYSTTTKKTITVNRSEQMLYAFEGNELFLEVPISTGIELTPTPRGTFTVFKKMPSRYMQGPLPYLASKKYYDLPGVPWNLYFTEGGAVIHGAYWHTSFGSAYSHGCVNVEPTIAYKLYNWAELGTTVIVKD